MFLDWQAKSVFEAFVSDTKAEEGSFVSDTMAEEGDYTLASKAEEGDDTRSPHRTTMLRLGSRFVITDMVSPGPESVAGIELERNMLRLRKEGYSGNTPLQGVSALNIPERLKENVAVFLAGSPANHDPRDKHLGESTPSKVRFKEQVFYSMCWYTPETSAVAMTFSVNACGRMEFWSLPTMSRVLMLTPAWFGTYRPRRGLDHTMEALADEEDTMLALYVPVAMVQKMRWRGDKLDAAASILAFMGANGRLLTFGAFTAELEVDILSAASRMEKQNVLSGEVLCDQGNQCDQGNPCEQGKGGAF